VNAGFMTHDGGRSGRAGEFGGGAIDNTGSFQESMYDMSRQLGNSGTGTGMHGAGGRMGNRVYDSWGSGGLGYSTGRSFSGAGGHSSYQHGMSIGAGGGSWNQTTYNDDGSVRRSAEGIGGGVGINQSYGGRFGAGDFSANYAYDTYRGVGGNAYSFEEGSRHGYGVDANYTPLGVNNAHGRVETGFGSAQGSVENMVFGQRSGSIEGWRDDELGRTGVDVGWSPGRTEIHGARGRMDTALGTTRASLGSYGPARSTMPVCGPATTAASAAAPAGRAAATASTTPGSATTSATATRPTPAWARGAQRTPGAPTWAGTTAPATSRARAPTPPATR